MFHVNANLTHVALSSRARSLLANLVLGALLLPMLSPLSKTAYGVSSAIPPITATHDGHVRGSNANEASLEGIFLKNAHPTSITNNRFGYARFEYNPNYQWNSASFEMTVSANDGGENPDTWGSSMTTFNVDVWGLSAADWDNDSLLHNTAKTQTMIGALHTRHPIFRQPRMIRTTISVLSQSRLVPTPRTRLSRWQTRRS